MILYALYHRPTGNYMPAKMFRCSFRGYSWWEPTGAQGLGGVSGVPRLFKTKHAANVAKTFWLKGCYKHNKVIESDGWDMPSYEITRGTVSAKEQLLPRNPDNLIIVTLELKEIK